VKELPILFAYFSRTINRAALIVRQMQPCIYQVNSIDDGRLDRGYPPSSGRFSDRRIKLRLQLGLVRTHDGAAD